MVRISQLRLPLEHTAEDLTKAAAKRLKRRSGDILELTIIKKSLDARRKENIEYCYIVDVTVKKEQEIKNDSRIKHITKAEQESYHYEITGSETMRYRPVVVGSGPAGLFCAYYLAKCGYRPIVIERGEPVEQRVKTVEKFWKDGTLSTESNVQFGEGGAGTFSDGKLNTMVKDTFGRIHEVLKTFVAHGAPEELLYWNKPHIGTDLLRGVVARLREHIRELGGEVRFQTKLVSLKEQDGKIHSIFVEHGETKEELPCDVLVLAIGHSARDTFERLYGSGIAMEAKAFAAGVRIEHEQEMISRAQYGKLYQKLDPADYKLTHTCADGRGAYTFCMCPGGFVVNASSEPERLVVNGMSNQDRGGKNANSAVIVTVTPEDFAKETGNCSPLSGMYFQRKFESLAYQTGAGKLPVQLFGDLLSNKKSATIGHIEPQNLGGYCFGNLRDCLPEYIVKDIIEGIFAFGQKLTGFDDEEAVLSGVEMRTSSPVRILRENSYESSSLKGLYPCGEGAGYAGGITSAAADGLKVFEAIIQKLLPPKT